MRTSYFLIVFNLTAFLAGATSSSTQRQHHTISKRGAENAEYAIEIGMEAYGSIMISLGRRGDAEVSAERRRTLEAQLASLVDSNEIFHTPDKFRAALTRIAGRDHIALERLACAFRDESESDFARILVDAKEEIEKSTKLGELNRRLSANVVRLERRRDVINIGGVQGASTTAEFVRSIRRRCETVQEYIEGYQQSSRELRIYRLWLQEQLRTMERSVDREQDSISRYYDQWRQFFTAFTSGRTYFEASKSPEFEELYYQSRQEAWTIGYLHREFKKTETIMEGADNLVNAEVTSIRRRAAEARRRAEHQNPTKVGG